MASVSIIRDGTTYSLDDGTLCYFIGQSGFGMSPLHRLSDRGPLQNGVTDRGFRLDPRVTRLFLFVDGTSLANLESKQASLLDIFKPSDTAIILKRVTAGGDTRYLDTHFVANMTFDTGQKNGFGRDLVATVYAPDPTWYDPVQESATFGVTAGSTGLVIPLPVPFKLGGSFVNQTSTINNAGQWQTYPIITVYGSLDDLIIVNNTTSETLDFTGQVLGGSDTRVIDCRYGYKTVVDGSGVNKISELVAGSDFATFHLDAGNNSITVTGSGADGSTEIYLRWYKRYIGL